MVILLTWWNVFSRDGNYDQHRAMLFPEYREHVDFRPYGANDVDVYANEAAFRAAFPDAPVFDANGNSEWTS